MESATYKYQGKYLCIDNRDKLNLDFMNFDKFNRNKIKGCYLYLLTQKYPWNFNFAAHKKNRWNFPKFSKENFFLQISRLTIGYSFELWSQLILNCISSPKARIADPVFKMRSDPVFKYGRIQICLKKILSVPIGLAVNSDYISIDSNKILIIMSKEKVNDEFY